MGVVHRISLAKEKIPLIHVQYTFARPPVKKGWWLLLGSLVWMMRLVWNWHWILIPARRLIGKFKAYIPYYSPASSFDSPPTWYHMYLHVISGIFRNHPIMGPPYYSKLPILFPYYSHTSPISLGILMGVRGPILGAPGNPTGVMAVPLYTKFLPKWHGFFSTPQWQGVLGGQLEAVNSWPSNHNMELQRKHCPIPLGSIYVIFTYILVDFWVPH